MEIVDDSEAGRIGRSLLISLIVAGWLLIIIGFYNNSYHLKPTSSISFLDGLAFLPVVLVPLVGKYVGLGGQSWRTGFRESMSGSDFLFITTLLAAFQAEFGYASQIEWIDPSKIFWPVLTALISGISGAIWIRKQAKESGWSLSWGLWSALLFSVVGGSTWMMENRIHAKLNFSKEVILLDKRFIAQSGKSQERRMISVNSPSVPEGIDWIRVSKISWDKMQPGDKIHLSCIRGGLGLDWWEYTGWHQNLQKPPG